MTVALEGFHRVVLVTFAVFHHQGTVNVNVLEIDFVPHCDGCTDPSSLGESIDV